jgi:hypothetical protein
MHPDFTRLSCSDCMVPVLNSVRGPGLREVTQGRPGPWRHGSSLPTCFPSGSCRCQAFRAPAAPEQYLVKRGSRSRFEQVKIAGLPQGRLVRDPDSGLWLTPIDRGAGTLMEVYAVEGRPCAVIQSGPDGDDPHGRLTSQALCMGAGYAHNLTLGSAGCPVRGPCWREAKSAIPVATAQGTERPIPDNAIPVKWMTPPLVSTGQWDRA